MPRDQLDWDDLLTRYEAMATAFVRGLVQDAELARDLFQEAARAAFERAAADQITFESPAHARNYLFRTLRNLAIDANRDRRQAPGDLTDEPSARGPSPLEDLAAREAAGQRHERIRAEFARLPEREQRALELRYLQGRSYKDIAAVTGKSISTVQARVTAGLARLRNRIGKPGHPP